MSIIHEALQKTQTSLRARQTGSTSQKENLRVERTDIFLVIVIAILLIIIVVAYYPRLTAYSSAKRSASPIVNTSQSIPRSTPVPQSMQPIMAPSPMQPVVMPQVMQQPVMYQPMQMAPAPQQYVQWVAPPQPVQPQWVQVVAAPQQQAPQMMQVMAPQQPMMQSAPTSQAFYANDTTYKSKLVLNGVLLADQEKIALINNQPYHLGDSVEGMKIVSIELNSITLQDGARMMVLRT